MSLQAAIASVDPEITVVHVSGAMTLEEASALISLVQVLLDRGEKRIVLELGGIQTIDSLGGTSLIRCFFAAREAGAHLCVASASPVVTRLFRDTRLNTLIVFFPTLAAACEALVPVPGGESRPAESR